MGSIGSRPKAPEPQIIYMPSPQTISQQQTSNVTEVNQDEIAAEVRKENLLRRSRSRFGTVVTGFRGLLSNMSSTDGRKKLLGE